jgi:hypothetical protein
VLLLVFLLLTSFAATIAIVDRAELDGRAEKLAAGTIVWNALITLPIFVLGNLNCLERTILAETDWALFFLCILCARQDGSAREVLKRIADRALDLLRLPVDSIRGLLKDRSPVILGVLFLAIYLPWTAFCAYVAPEDRHWDGLWYHESITAFAIQNHGFADVDLPVALQWVNGIERVCEMTQLWFGILVGRRLIDLTNVLFFPGQIAAVFLLVRRYTQDRWVALGWAAALAMLPVNLHYLRTTLIDSQVATLFLVTVYFVTHPRLTPARVWFAIFALMLYVGSKPLALRSGAVLAVVLAVRLILLRKSLGKRLFPFFAVGTTGILGIVASVHLRNYRVHGNPFWPYLRLKVDALGIDWPNAAGWSGEQGGLASLNASVPLHAVLARLFGIPYERSALDKNLWQVSEYSAGVAYVLLPLTAGALLVLVVRVLQAARSPATRPQVVSLSFLAALVIGEILVSPALFTARYYIGTLGLMMVLVAWAASVTRYDRLSEAGAFATQVAALACVVWAVPSWYTTPAQIARLLQMPAAGREEQDLAERQTELPFSVWAQREREIGKDTVVAFNDIEFVSVLFNDHYSNRVVWVHGDDPIADAKAAGATWLFAGRHTDLVEKLHDDKDWDDVGPIWLAGDNSGGTVFRYLGPGKRHAALAARAEEQ